MPLYVCEHRYKDDVKQFKKIKSWSSCIPEEIRAHEYEFEPYADGHVDQLARVKSPFTRGVPGPGRLDSGRSNTNPKAAPAYRFSNDGRPQTLEEAQGDVPVTAEAAAPATDLSVGPPAPEVPPPQLDLAALTAPAPSQSAAPQAAEGHGAAVVPSSAIPQGAGPSFDFSNGGLAGLPAFASPGAGTPAEVAATDEACIPIPPNLSTSEFPPHLRKGCSAHACNSLRVEIPQRRLWRAPVVLGTGGYRPSRPPRVAFAGIPAVADGTQAGCCLTCHRMSRRIACPRSLVVKSLLPLECAPDCSNSRRNFRSDDMQERHL